MWSKQYQDCLSYIDDYWEKIIYKPSELRLKYRIKLFPYELPYSENFPFSKRGRIRNKALGTNVIRLPNYYFVPNDNKFTYIYYWDSFFMFRGLMGTKREWLMRNMVENFIYLFNMYDIIPNFSAPASMGRSQPPFLSSMIMDTYLKRLNPTNPYRFVKGIHAKFYTYTNRAWLRQAIAVAKREYELVWIDKSGIYNHSVKGHLLSRYGDRDIGYAHSSELESGWDMTSRFYNRCDQFLPIDLNSYLYKYETDFAEAARLLNDRREEAFWKKRALLRKEEINKYMWDESRGIFADYGYVYKRISTFRSLASFTPLWAGIATTEQARRMIEMLHRFESPFGLTITTKGSLAHPMPDITQIEKRYHPAIIDIFKSKQWDYPNIWAPLEYLTIIGLLKYKFIDDARRIMINSVKAHATLFRKYGTFFEKINGETGEAGSAALYEDQKGFGWTNAIFYRYIQLLDALDSGQQIYKNSASQEPPYDLIVLS